MNNFNIKRQKLLIQLSFTFLTLISLNACIDDHSKKAEQSEIIEIKVDISKSIERSEFVHKVYNYISDIDFIKLETTEHHVINRIEKMLLHKNKLIIMQEISNPILIFNSDGSLYKSIDQFGKGPNEMQEVRDIIIIDDNIAVLDYNKIQYCNSNYEIEKSESIINTFSAEEFINPLKFYRDDHFTYLWSGSLG